ncbi:UvrD-helicase domain-containing protein [Paractinoplanes brasiliensis]|uniref:UvrD-helicase domain-containing protein n=1 Tax=Paractinoplanes brasiliensis TaxID=52695 RepID=UPI0010607133|nr:UvrD-helicase domain-containing protein [Actinoplanes brasiliensis]
MAEVLAAEQKYFDHVSDHRERMRRALLDAPAAAANAGAAVHLRKDAEARLQRIGEPDDAVAVGRMDDEDGDVLYVGYHTIFDDDSEVLVVNWQAPAAARYFTATHADAQGLARKRSFETTGNVVNAYEDTVFRQLAAAVAELEEPGDALLDDLNRDRTGQMHDIVRTIQAAQFDLIRAPLDEMLIIQGGPGTGKTAVALHRVSWLLFNYRGTLQPEDVLIVGPSPTFTRYTRTVLPSLGDTSVAQRDIGQFHPPVRRGRLEEAEVARLKGDGRMAGLLRRALYDRVGVPADQLPVEAQLDGRPVVFTADEINEFVARSRQTPGTFGQQRQIFRSLMLNSATERARERRLGVRTALDQLIERIWPTFTAAAFLRDLFGSRDRLIAAAGEELTVRDVALLHRRGAERISDEVWSAADLPLLDYLEALIHGIEQRYGHIVVDEAQDLSPMQLRSIAMRSSTGSMTVVGDIAQSTGLWARDDWDDVLEHLPAQLPQRLAELRYGYRVPRQVFEIAARLLPYAAPEVTAPQVVRDGPADPVFRLTDDDSRASIAVETAMAHASHGRSVAIICPAAHRWAVESELTARDVAWRAASRNELGQGVNLVSPHEAKGLEFDATVVVEPRDIIAEDERGHRLLYVALTRTTRYLAVIGILPPVGDAVLELEPLDRFELTQSLPAPTAIGTATVPSPRTADNREETPPGALPFTVPSADEPSVLSSRLAAALSADGPWTSRPTVPPPPDEKLRSPSAAPSSEPANSATPPTVTPLATPATSAPVAAAPAPAAPAPEPSVSLDGPAPGVSGSERVFGVPAAVSVPAAPVSEPVSGVLVNAPAPAGSGSERVFGVPAAESAPAAPVSEPVSGVLVNAPAPAGSGSERVFGVPAAESAPAAPVSEPVSGVLVNAPAPAGSGAERLFDVPLPEPAFDAPVAEAVFDLPVPGAVFDAPLSGAPSAETVSGTHVAEAVPPAPATATGSAVPRSGFKLATPLPAFEASVAETGSAGPVADLGSALPAPAPTSGVSRSGVPTSEHASAVPATAPTSAVPAIAPTSAVPATASTSEHASPVPAIAPTSAVPATASTSEHASPVPAIAPTSAVPATASTSEHASPVPAIAPTSAVPATASTSEHASPVPAIAPTSAVPATASTSEHASPVPAIAPTSAVPATASTSEHASPVPAIAPTSAVPATASTSEHASPVPAIAPTSAVPATASTSEHASPVPAIAPTSAVPATASTSEHASPVPAIAPTSAVPATASTSEHASPVPAIAPTSAVPATAPISAVPATAPGSAVPATASTSGVSTAEHASPVLATAPASAALVTAPASSGLVAAPASAGLVAAPGSAVPATAPTPAVPVAAPAPPVAVPASAVAAPAPAALVAAPAAPAPPASPVAPQPAPPSPAAPSVAAPVSAVTPSVAAARARGGSLSAQIVELAAAELAGQIRDNLQPSQWQAVVQRVGELLTEE